jgi:hypothetical protein
VSLGKGYFELIFSSFDDLSGVRYISFWNLLPDLLRTFASADFNSFTIQPTNAHYLNIPDSIASNLKANVSDFIVQNDWHLPEVLHASFPTLHLLVRQVIIPFDPGEDSLIWLRNDSGDFSHKDAFKFKSQNHPQLQWAKAIWSLDIPPSNSLVVWRFMLGKLPTDDNLMLRGSALFVIFA